MTTHRREEVVGDPFHHHDDHDDDRPDRRRLHSNAATLRETKELQENTLQSLERIHRTNALTKDVGGDTLRELRKQGETLDRVQNQNDRLKAGLDSASGLQNRLARVKLRFGTKRRAKKEMKGEQQKQQQQKATFKRRGPRAKKEVTTPDHPTENEIKGEWYDSVQSNNNINSTINNNNNKRKDLFSNTTKGSVTNTTKKSSSSSSSSSSPEPPGQESLTDKDRRDLNNIAATDTRIDEGIDALGDEVAALLTMSRAMGDEVLSHNAKLETVRNDVYRNNNETRFLDENLKLLAKRRSKK